MKIQTRGAASCIYSTFLAGLSPHTINLHSFADQREFRIIKIGFATSGSRGKAVQYQFKFLIKHPSLERESFYPILHFTLGMITT